VRETQSMPGVPFDRRLPALARVLDARAMAPLLRPAFGGRDAIAAALVKHAPGKRCVVAYTAADGSRVIGKVYRKDRARSHAALQRELGQVLAGDTRAARILDCIEELGLVLQEWVPGNALAAYDAWSMDEAARMGRALADLHAAPLPAAPLADLQSHVRRTCHPGLDALARAVPAVASGVLAVQAAIAEAAPSAALVTSHGDFGPRAAFAAGPRTWLVDLDGLCRTDPAFDVAGVTVGLVAHRGETGRELAAAFVTAYRAGGGAALPALPVHEAFAWLRRAVIVWRKQPAGWEDALVACVERAQHRI